MQRLVALTLAAAGCGSGDRASTEAFGFVGEVADFEQNASSLGLWVVSSAQPVSYYKFGDGSTVANQFDISFASEPPLEALSADGIGVALIGLLPGLATVSDGEVDIAQLRLVGLTTDHAVVFKSAGAAGPAWSAQFPTGFACARCVRDADALDTFEPVLCALVVVEAVFNDPCVWY